MFSLTSLADELTITNVAIQNDTVVVTVSQSRTQSIASCVDNGNANKWAFSLASSEGKNLYRGVVAAHSSGNAVTITPTGDCQALTGIERPQGIEINLL